MAVQKYLLAARFIISNKYSSASQQHMQNIYESTPYKSSVLVKMTYYNFAE